MKVLSDESIRECFDFLTQYYLVKDEVKISVAMAINEMEWKKLYTWICISRETLQEWCEDEKKRRKLSSLGMIKEADVFEYYESHMPKRTKIDPLEEWRDTSGYFCESSAIKIYLAIDEKNREILEKPFREVLRDSKWFIFLRDTKDRFINLVNLFHEMLHIIEREGHHHIFRGSSKEAEIKDTREIVFRLVKQFLRSHKSSLA